MDDAQRSEEQLAPEPVEAIGPDGRVYRVVAVRRGRSLNPADSSSFDLTSFALGIAWEIAVAINASRFRQWKVGVVDPRSPLFGGGVKYKELVDDESTVLARMDEVARLVASRGPKLSAAEASRS